MKTNKNFGLTILELLVVIAIIGILTTVVLTSLSNQRSKAKIASAQTTMGSIKPLVVTCLDDNSLINNAVVGELICDTTNATWPELAGGWFYTEEVVYNTDSNTFSFTSSDDVGNSITCDESNGCVTDLAE